MPIRTWHEFDLDAGSPKLDETGLRGLSVRLLGSPAGATDALGRKASPVTAAAIRERLGLLETRDLDEDGLIALGADLADLLLPPGIRELLARSLDGLGQDEGLRVRLRLDPAVADIPWEYLWVPRQGGQRDSTGFLALDPRISIVRDETVTGRVAADDGPRERRVVAVLANPAIPGTRPLKLDAERVNLETALAGVPGISVDVLPEATLRGLTDLLLDGADVFHFAGHGLEDTLILVGDQDKPWPMPAGQLAINLRARRVQLVVLGACDSGERDPRDRWSGVATRLIADGIPAVVAMQYRISDRTAIAFGERFYQALAAGWSLDEAVAAGRLAIFNVTTGGAADPRRARLWRDWGVPVLYLRPDAAVSLASVAGVAERERLEEDLVSTVRVRTADVMQGGRVTGVKGGSGVVDVEVVTGDVHGEVTGLDRAEGAGADVDVTVRNVEAGGEVIGASLDTVGARRRSRRQAPRASGEEEP